MDRPIDLERLSEVFTDHPWLAEALSTGAWWGNCDGTVQVVAPVGDPVAVRAALVAFAEALGCEVSDVGLDVAVPGEPSEPSEAVRRAVASARPVGRK